MRHILEQTTLVLAENVPVSDQHQWCGHWTLAPGGGVWRGSCRGGALPSYQLIIPEIPFVSLYITLSRWRSNVKAKHEFYIQFINSSFLLSDLSLHPFYFVHFCTYSTFNLPIFASAFHEFG